VIGVIWGVTEEHPNADDLRAKVFRDRVDPAKWRVEKMDEDRGYECVEVFAGPNARQRAIDYARYRFSDFDEITLEPYRRAGDERSGHSGGADGGQAGDTLSGRLSYIGIS
jgi:hypothetical protein